MEQNNNVDNSVGVVESMDSWSDDALDRYFADKRRAMYDENPLWYLA